MTLLRRQLYQNPKASGTGGSNFAAVYIICSIKPRTWVLLMRKPIRERGRLAYLPFHDWLEEGGNLNPTDQAWEASAKEKLLVWYKMTYELGGFINSTGWMNHGAFIVWINLHFAHFIMAYLSLSRHRRSIAMSMKMATILYSKLQTESIESIIAWPLCVCFRCIPVLQRMLLMHFSIPA